MKTQNDQDKPQNFSRFMDISMSSKDDEIMKFCKFEEKQLNSVNDNVKQLF